MTAPQHTPGPWLTEYNREDGSWIVWTRQPHTGQLATVHPEDINGKYPAKANARLIAAAPDLLAALEALENVAYLHDWPELDRARAAIAKARGE